MTHRLLCIALLLCLSSQSYAARPDQTGTDRALEAGAEHGLKKGLKKNATDDEQQAKRNTSQGPGRQQQGSNDYITSNTSSTGDYPLTEYPKAPRYPEAGIGSELESEFRYILRHESLENGGHASSIGIESVVADFFYGGLSLNYITSDSVIQSSSRRTIVPMYAYIGMKAPWRITPYAEFGLDLPEAIIDDTFNSEKDAINEMDYYVAGGIELHLSRSLSVSVYMKQYHFIFRQDYTSPLSKAIHDSQGVNLSFHF